MENKDNDATKVFVSYAHGTKEYNKKVDDFVNHLTMNGIKVCYDKSDLNVGDNIQLFMEKNITDKKYILVLLNREYKEKADNRDAGVGYETNIITNVLNDNFNQHRVIPIIFEKKENEDCVPKFLKHILCLDLTNKDTQKEQFEKLITILRDEISNSSMVTTNECVSNFYNQRTKSIYNEEEKQKHVISNFLYQIEETLYIDDGDETKKEERYFSVFSNLRKQMIDVFEVFIEYDKLDNKAELLIDFFTKFYYITEANDINKSLKKVILHEMFLNVVGHLFNVKDYQTLKTILTNSYFLKINGKWRYLNFTIFNSHSLGYLKSVSERIHKMVNEPIERAIGKLWVEGQNDFFCPRDVLILMDLLLNNFVLSEIINNNEKKYYWFPELFIFDEFYENLKSFSERMKSRQFALKILDIFGIDSIENFKQYYDKMKGKSTTLNQAYEYISENTISSFAEFIEFDEIGKYN